jgi:capsular polysaccharide biosynthesis protein
VDALARSFIYVNISVLNNEALAKEIYQKVIRVLPDFVETNMAVPAGYDGTNCQQITRNDGIRLTNDGLVSSTAIKYALILAFASLVVACVAIVVVDHSDKRVKNVEQITQIFNIPLLGVIPSIKTEPLSADTEQADLTEVTK